MITNKYKMSFKTVPDSALRTNEIHFLFLLVHFHIDPLLSFMEFLLKHRYCFNERHSLLNNKMIGLAKQSAAK